VTCAGALVCLCVSGRAPQAAHRQQLRATTAGHSRPIVPAGGTGDAAAAPGGGGAAAMEDVPDEHQLDWSVVLLRFKVGGRVRCRSARGAAHACMRIFASAVCVQVCSIALQRTAWMTHGRRRRHTAAADAATAGCAHHCCVLVHMCAREPSTKQRTGRTARTRRRSGAST
jgi:hypothetical protein